jgi:hypothetical protein
MKIDTIDQIANLSLVSIPLLEEVLVSFVLDVMDEEIDLFCVIGTFPILDWGMDLS